jgi:predicted nucleotidyltransferase component of viral defense system
MIGLQEIRKFYPESLHGYKQFMLREYLQYKILEIIYESKFANKLCFLGGTCLRIVHNNTRFSEDLDFDNFNLTEVDFANISEIIIKQLTREGYNIEVKTVIRGAFHCYIRFPELLFDEGLSGHAEEKILIQLDTEPQHFEFTPQLFILNKFDVFTQIAITPPDILLSQKIFALINRKRKKGRDFFDIIFLFKSTRPNYKYLDMKLNISNDKQLKEMLLMLCSAIHLNDMADDVKPFLFSPTDIKIIQLFPQYIEQIL